MFANKIEDEYGSYDIDMVFGIDMQIGIVDKCDDDDFAYDENEADGTDLGVSPDNPGDADNIDCKTDINYELEYGDDFEYDEGEDFMYENAFENDVSQDVDEKELSHEERKQIKKKNFNRHRVEWFCKEMKGDVSYVDGIHVSFLPGKQLSTYQQHELGKIVQAGHVARVILSKCDRLGESLGTIVERESGQILDFLEEEGYQIDNDSITDEEFRKIEIIAEEGMKARNVLAEKNIGLVNSIANKFKIRKNLSADLTNELIEEGRYGLMKAIDHFDPSMGTRFSTPASAWIKQPILDYLDSKTKTIRMPTHMNNLFRNILYAQKELKKIYGEQEDITDEQIATWLQEHGRNVNVAKIEQAWKYRRETISYESSIGSGHSKNSGGDDLKLKDTLGGDDDIENETVNVQSAQDRFIKLLSLVEDDRNRTILRDWYSSNELNDVVTLSNISRKYCLTKERTKQLKKESENEIMLKMHTLTSGDCDKV